MTPGVVHRASEIFLTVEENSGKLQLGDHLMKSVRPVIVSNWVGGITQVREGGGRKREKDGITSGSRTRDLFVNSQRVLGRGLLG